MIGPGLRGRGTFLSCRVLVASALQFGTGWFGLRHAGCLPISQLLVIVLGFLSVGGVRTLAISKPFKEKGQATRRAFDRWLGGCLRGGDVCGGGPTDATTVLLKYTSCSWQLGSGSVMLGWGRPIRLTQPSCLASTTLKWIAVGQHLQNRTPSLHLIFGNNLIFFPYALPIDLEHSTPLGLRARSHGTYQPFYIDLTIHITHFMLSVLYGADTWAFFFPLVLHEEEYGKYEMSLVSWSPRDRNSPNVHCLIYLQTNSSDTIA